MPLPPEVLEKVRANLTKAEERIPGLEENLRDAKRAGIDMTDQEARLAELRKHIHQMRLVYGYSE